MTKTFILGVGAQKGGTTWLHRQLNSNSNIDFGFRKEYHVFDAIEDDKNHKSSKQSKNGFRDRRINKILKEHKRGILGRNLGSQRKKAQNLALELAFIDNVEHYFDYFDYLYLKNDHIDAVGDITPNYALLKEKSFTLIREGLETRGFDVKVFFLMRDPVERAWSAARMRQRNMRDDKKATFDQFAFMEKAIKDGPTRYKSQYERTIHELEQTFKQDQIYYGFYESLFDKTSFQAIQRFLNIPLDTFDASQVFNASPKSSSLPTELNQKLVKRFQPTYDFIADRHGESIKELWQGYQLL